MTTAEMLKWARAILEELEKRGLEEYEDYDARTWFRWGVDYLEDLQCQEDERIETENSNFNRSWQGPRAKEA